MLSEAYRRSPADPLVRFHMGVAWMETGQEEKGRRELRSVLMGEGVPKKLRERIRRVLR